MFSGKRHQDLSIEVLKSFHISSEPGVQISRTAHTLAAGLGADLCQILVRGPESDLFLLRGSAGQGGGRTAEPDPALDKNLQILADSGSVHSWSADQGDPPFFSSVLSQGLGCAVAVPVPWKGRTVALVIVGFSRKRRISSRVVRDLQVAACSLAPFLRGSLSRLYQTRKNELSGLLLKESESLSAAGSVQACFAQIARTSALLTGSAGAILRVEEDQDLKVKAFFVAGSPGIKVIGTPNDLPFAKKAFLSGRSVVSNKIEDENPEHGGPIRRNLLCVPFSQGKNRGVLTIFDRTDGQVSLPFSRLERETIRAFLRVAVLSLQHITNQTDVLKISRSLEWRVRELTLLHQISRAVLDRNEVHEVLRSLLEAMTNEVEFGFNRAFLFMNDQRENILQGLMGVEALPALTGEAKMAGHILPYAVPHRSLDDMVSSLRVPVQEGGGALSRAVLERRPFRIRMPGDRELLGSEVIRKLGDIQTFAVAPLLSNETVLGVIWVDNFRTMRPIRPEDFRLLVTAAAQAALAIERSSRAEALDHLNSQLLNLQKQLIQWEKLAALGEMAASVAHDIRNPLVSIGGFARRLKKLLPQNEKGEKYIQIIIQEVDRLEWTLENVMSYARSYGMIKKKPSRLYGLLSECAELFIENFRKKRVDLRRHFERNIPEILLDERQIKQALINILFNAGESVSEGGTVGLSARTEGNKQGHFVVIDIVDNGEGIASENIEKIFLPFFTTKAAGTGLGLAIAHRAISGHGGEIRVDNRLGEGVTFSLYLPVSPADDMEE